MKRERSLVIAILVFLVITNSFSGSYKNFESSHVHPISLTPTGQLLCAVNTPDAALEIFQVLADGTLSWQASVPVGLEPVSVRTRSDTEAWVANNLSDTVSIVDLTNRQVSRTLSVGDEPTDIAFASGKAFVAVSEEDTVKVFSLSDLSAPPQRVDLFSRDVRALAATPDGATVYAVTLRSGNRTTVVNDNIIAANMSNLDPARLSQLGLQDVTCNGAPPPYPPLPSGIQRNPALTDPADGKPKTALIVHWNPATSRWEDEAGQNWTNCLPFRLPDYDLFAINALTLDVTRVSGVGTTLFDVSVNPANGKVYVPNTEARNFVRFEHPLGVRGHVVDNRMSIVDPSAGNAVTIVDLNSHINRASDPSTNLAERVASISQPGMMVWKSDGSAAFLTAIGSRKLFRVSGSCLSPSCIFGPDRAAPQAVEVGEGPTGVALHEGRERLYVLNRFSNSIALVDSSSLVKLAEVPLHDPSSVTIKLGRRLLYDGIYTSGHGDNACSSCHISADMDGLSWDLGNPEGSFTPYGLPGDNVRFITPTFAGPQTCNPVNPSCASHAGFDPQKGPMITQTLREPVEPLHWRGDRPTLAAFNGAFVNLLGKQDIGSGNGLSDEEVQELRHFLLEIQFPPNPYRNTNDSLPDAVVQVPGHPVSGNPKNGETIFNTAIVEQASVRCVSCHSSSMGSSGGKLGGIEPSDPPSAKAALVKGALVQSIHSDMKIPQLRNLYEKIGPVFGSYSSPPDRKTGFGFRHEGSISDLATFLSSNIFSLTASQIRDVSTFALHFATGTKPAVGKNLTVPPGAPPTGSAADEALLSLLLTLGDEADLNRHCELTATTLLQGRIHSYHLVGGFWTSDLSAEDPIDTTTLRISAQAPITFLCATLGSGERLGGDLDEDAALNGDDCSPADPGAWQVPAPVAGLIVTEGLGAVLTWQGQGQATGPGILYHVLGGSLSLMRTGGLSDAACVASALTQPYFWDGRPDPAAQDGYYYQVRAVNTCGSGGFEPGRESLNAIVCTP